MRACSLMSLMSPVRSAACELRDDAVVVEVVERASALLVAFAERVERVGPVELRAR